MTVLPSPIGPLTITGTDQSINRIDFGSKKNTTSKPKPPESRCIQELTEYFKGERIKFSVPMEATGTAFRLQVYKAMQAIPFGETRTYGDIAKAIGNPKAIRAVGGACGANPLPILIPCHRVVGSNGIGGYNGGIRRKMWLLEHEKIHRKRRLLR
ncbi:MAG: methylated-DNA--[protein]-cysteine S-methyltransferase [Candidatus Peribacteraceae bacterium]|nr:methylated-DNA--[protein]-cysteine S-methyltransferase [Candidatus Peribacteraceae bacterium]